MAKATKERNSLKIKLMRLLPRVKNHLFMLTENIATRNSHNSRAITTTLKVKSQEPYWKVDSPLLLPSALLTPLEIKSKVLNNSSKILALTQE